MIGSDVHIALPWHSIGHGNLGIDALTQANIAILRNAARKAGRIARFTTLCSPAPMGNGNVPDDVTIGPMPRPKAALLGKSDFMAVLKSADLVVDIGEGDSWTDIYSTKRFFFHAGTKLAALAVGTPLVLAPQTIGPFNSSTKRIVANGIMNRARAVFARDNMSKAYLDAHLTGVAYSDEFIDVAFRLPFESRYRGDNTKRVGLNVSGLLYQGGYTGRNEFGLTLNYKDLTNRLIVAFMEMDNTEVYLLPHVVGVAGNDGDLAVVPELTSRFPGLIVPETFHSASEAKSYISQMDFVVGGRMHACIGAFSASVPVVPVAYSRKFNGLFDTLQYPHYVDGKTTTTGEAFTQIMRGFNDRAILAADIATALTVAHGRLDRYEDRMAQIIGELP